MLTRRQRLRRKLTRYDRFKIKPERMAQFERRKNDDGTDEDVYLWIARQINMATPYELTALFIIRDDELAHRRQRLSSSNASMP